MRGRLAVETGGLAAFSRGGQIGVAVQRNFHRIIGRRGNAGSGGGAANSPASWPMI
jgi:hypothetical protein